MAEEFKGFSNESLRNVQGVRDAMREVDLAIRDLNKQLTQTGRKAEDIRSEFSSISNSAKKFADLQDQASRSSKATTDSIKEQQKQLNIVRSLNVRIDDLYKQAAITAKEGKKDSAETAFNLKKQAENLANARDNAKVLATEYGKLAEDSSKLDRSTMWFSAFSEFSQGIPGLKSFSQPFQDAAEAARKQVLENAKAVNLKERIGQLTADELRTGRGLTADRIKQLGLEDIVGKKRGFSAAQALRMAKDTAKTQNIGLTGLMSGFKALGPIITKAFVPLALLKAGAEVLKFIFEASIAADKRTTDVAKNLMLTKEAASGIYINLTEMSNELDTSYRTTQNTVDAFNQLNELTDFVTLGTKEQVETQIKLTKELGLSVDEALALQSIFAINNTEADEGLDIINDQIAAFANENKILADSSKISKQIASTNKLILLNFKGNREELTKTVLEANKLGLSLDQVNKIAGSLLNFEQSIEAEINAELLTNKQINLDKARQFALTKDIAGLTEEIKKSGVDQLFLNAKTRPEQEAIAAAYGMQADEMADMIYKSQLIDKVAGNYTKKLREQAKSLRDQKEESEAILLENRAAAIERGVFEGKSIEQAKAQVNTQEKFNLALERAKDLFADFVGPEGGGALSKLVDYLERIVKDLESGRSLGSILFFGPSVSYNPEELIKTAQQNNLSYSATQIEAANTTFKSRSQGLTSAFTGNSQYMPVISELEFLAETIDAIIPYSDVSYYNRDRQAERMLEEIKQSNAATQKAIQEQTQAIKADKQVTVSVDGEKVFNVMGRTPMK